MSKISYAIVILGMLVWSGAARAVLQETTVTITDNGKPLPSATVTLNSVTPTDKPNTPTDNHETPRPKTAKTDENGKIVLEYDDGDKKSNSLFDVTIATDDGKTFTRRSSLADLLANVPFDVSGSECTDLRKLSDAQLSTILDNPEMRTRISTLIDERNQTARERRKTEQQHEMKTQKSKKTTKRRNKNSDEDSRGPSQSNSDTNEAIATGASIAIGIGLGAIGRRGGGGHDTMRRGRDMRER